MYGMNIVNILDVFRFYLFFCFPLYSLIHFFRPLILRFRILPLSLLKNTRALVHLWNILIRKRHTHTHSHICPHELIKTNAYFWDQRIFQSLNASPSIVTQLFSILYYKTSSQHKWLSLWHSLPLKFLHFGQTFPSIYIVIFEYAWDSQTQYCLKQLHTLYTDEGYGQYVVFTLTRNHYHT